MTKACEKWKDQLLEAALTGARPKDLQVHLQSCRDCTTELRDLEALRARQDSMLPLLVKGSQPSTGFRARVPDSSYFTRAVSMSRYFHGCSK